MKFLTNLFNIMHKIHFFSVISNIQTTSTPVKIFYTPLLGVPERLYILTEEGGGGGGGGYLKY